MIKKQTIINHLYNKEIKKFIESNGTEAIKQTSSEAEFIEGNVVFPVPYDRNSIKSLLNGARSIHSADIPEALINDDEDQMQDWYTENLITKIKEKIYREFNGYAESSGESRLAYTWLFKEVTRKIVKFDKYMTFNECMDLAVKFRNKLGSKFYGCLLKVKGIDDTFINPFHMLTTLTLINGNYAQKDFVDLNGKNFMPIIYLIENEECFDAMYYSVMADMAKVDESINYIMQAYTSKQPAIVKVLGSNVDNPTKQQIDEIANGTLKIEVDYVIGSKSGSVVDNSPESKEWNHYVICHQLMANGTIAPFYGSSLVRIKKNLSESKGTRLSPFPTANISSANYNFDGVLWDSVCTGSTHRNTTLRGLRTQTHVNYGSPYGSSKTYMPGCLMYARRMIERSLDIYRKTNFIETEEPDVAIDYNQIIENVKNVNDGEFFLGRSLFKYSPKDMFYNDKNKYDSDTVVGKMYNDFSF